MFVITKDIFCRDKSMLVMTKTFVAKIFCCDKYMFVATKVLSRQAYFCCDKYMFVATKVLSRQAYFCCDKRRLLSQWKYACHDKIMFVMTNICCLNKSFVMTSILLSSQQKTCFVMTNMCLSWQKLYVAAPANDNKTHYSYCPAVWLFLYSATMYSFTQRKRSHNFLPDEKLQQQTKQTKTNLMPPSHSNSNPNQHPIIPEWITVPLSKSTPRTAYIIYTDT